MRLIDADAFCEFLKEYGQECMRGERWTSLTYIWTHVQNMPTATTKPHWIPCSEKLPELDDEVLVTDDRGGLRHCIFCTWGETWCGFITYEEGMRIKAAAWMPLPPAYKGDE